MINERSILIVGAGRMARAHAAAARDLGWLPRAVTRSAATAEAFLAETGHECDIQPDLDAALSGRAVPPVVVVATGVEVLASHAVAAIAGGARRLLLEKPGGTTVEEISAVAAAARDAHADVFVAYNRRFYASTKRARDLIHADGGATSLRFDFTELSAIVPASAQPVRVKENWLLANSSHVIDLAFHLAGSPATLDATTRGSLDWHPAGASFAGSGTLESGGVFSYLADWMAPGRWSVDIRTANRRLLLEPLEELREQLHGSFQLVPVDLPDVSGKPGITEQMRAFLDCDATHLVGIAEHLDHATHLYQAMLPARSVD